MTNKEAAFILSDKCDDYTVEELSKAFDLAIKALEERPHGRWIREEDRVHSKCSLCGFKYADYGILFDYCPNCGADMRGNDND